MYQPLDSCTVDLDDETYETDWRDVGSESSAHVRDGRSAPRHANPTRPKLDRIATSSSVTHQRSLNVTTRLRHPLSHTPLHTLPIHTHSSIRHNALLQVRHPPNPPVIPPRTQHHPTHNLTIRNKLQNVY
jgi:hypothetical protein